MGGGRWAVFGQYLPRREQVFPPLVSSSAPPRAAGRACVSWKHRMCTRLLVVTPGVDTGSSLYGAREGPWALCREFLAISGPRCCYAGGAGVSFPWVAPEKGPREARSPRPLPSRASLALGTPVSVEPGVRCCIESLRPRGRAELGGALCGLQLGTQQGRSPGGQGV